MDAERLEETFQDTGFEVRRYDDVTGARMTKLMYEGNPLQIIYIIKMHHKSWLRSRFMGHTKRSFHVFSRLLKMLLPKGKTFITPKSLFNVSHTCNCTESNSVKIYFWESKILYQSQTTDLFKKALMSKGKVLKV